jgi:hypothetical protein
VLELVCEAGDGTGSEGAAGGVELGSSLVESFRVTGSEKTIVHPEIIQPALQAFIIVSTAIIVAFKQRPKPDAAGRTRIIRERARGRYSNSIYPDSSYSCR